MKVVSVSLLLAAAVSGQQSAHDSETVDYKLSRDQVMKEVAAMHDWWCQPKKLNSGDSICTWWRAYVASSPNDPLLREMPTDVPLRRPRGWGHAALMLKPGRSIPRGTTTSISSMRRTSPAFLNLEPSLNRCLRLVMLTLLNRL